MRGITRRSPYCLVGIALAAWCLVFALSSNLPGQDGRGQGQAQGQGRGQARPAVAEVPKGFFNPGLNTKLLPPGGPAPRMADGHVDLSGRYYPNGTGRMVGAYTPGGVDADAAGLLPPGTQQESPDFRPETKSKYQYPTPYGSC